MAVQFLLFYRGLGCSISVIDSMGGSKATSDLFVMGVRKLEKD
jgi:hypothetical protein